VAAGLLFLFSFMFFAVQSLVFGVIEYR